MQKITLAHPTKQLFYIVSFSLLLFSLAGCSFFGDREEEELGADMQEAELYEEASSLLRSSQYNIAAGYLQVLEANFPFGAYAEQSQLDLIYAYFRSAQYVAATTTADRFIRLHPEHPNIDYAYYMRGLISFNQETSFLGNFLPLDVTNRDPGSARESFSYFSEFLARFPNSQYAPDARKRMIYLRNLLARHEINVANYYFERGAYLAATNRGRYVVESFQGSPAVPDGLAVMAQGYTLLDMPELAQNSVQVLRENYPDHPALDENGNLINRDIEGGVQRSWLNRISFGILDQPEQLGFDTREMYDPGLRQ
jgi:outer membrane protein assembly factor BamD